MGLQSQADTVSLEKKGGSSVVDIEQDDDGATLLLSKPEVVVPCNLCKVTSSKDDVIDNYFLQYEKNDEEDDNDVATHICQVIICSSSIRK